MKIVHISTSDIKGGAARAAYRLHKGLNKLGEESSMVVRMKHSLDPSVKQVNLSTTKEQSYVEYCLSTTVQGNYINKNRSDISNTIFTLPYPGYDFTEADIIRNAQIINIHWVSYFLSIINIRKLCSLNKHVVFTLHDQWAFTGGCHYSSGCDKYRSDCFRCPQLSDDPFNLPSAILQDKIELFREVDFTVIAPSRWMAECAKESTLFRDRRIEVIPNSLEVDLFSPLPKAEAKEKIGLSPGSLTILFCAEFGNETRKGFKEMLKAIRFCSKDHEFQNLLKKNKVRLLCIGEPSDELSALNIPVVSLGYVNDDRLMRNIYSASDLYVLPSIEDNLPNTMLEAMSCGTPVVAFDVGGMPDMIIDNVTGRLAPLRDFQKMGGAILELINNHEQRAMMGKNCRNIIKESHMLTEQGNRYLKLYKELIDGDTASIFYVTAGAADKTSAQNVSLDARLTTAIGPHFLSIYEPVLQKALKELTLARLLKSVKSSEKDNKAGRQLLFLAFKITYYMRAIKEKLTKHFRKLCS